MTRSDGRVAKVFGLVVCLLFVVLIRLVVICLVAICALAVPARADAPDEVGARVLFAEGRKLADAGRYAEACLKFEESLRLDPGVGTSFNLADCQEHTGRVASAWARFLDVAAATKRGGQLERERVARARAAALEPRLPRLVIEVPTPVEALVIDRDGVPVGSASWGTGVPVDPGPHLVTARAPGRKEWSANATAPEGPTTIVVSVPTLDERPDIATRHALTTAVPAPEITATDLPSARPARRLTTPVVALSALGFVGLATAAVFAFELHSANDAAKGLCVGPNNTCQNPDELARHAGLVAEAHRDQTAAGISAGIGAAALLGAAYLAWRPTRAPASAPRISLAPLTLSASGAAGALVDVAW